MEYDMKDVIGRQAGKDQRKNILSGLLHNDQKYREPSNTDAQDLVVTSMKLLQKADWKTQKTGVTMLLELAQKPHGAVIVQPRIPQIIEMILPENYHHIRPSLLNLFPILPTSIDEGPSQAAPVATTTELAKTLRLRLASSVMGPTYALQSLQRFIRDAEEYRDLKHLHLYKALISEKETAPWHVYTPTKSDVAVMMGKMIEVVDGELSEEGVNNTLSPSIQHWDRAFMFLGYTVVGTVLFPVALGTSIGFSALSVVVVAVGAPIYLSVEAFNLIRRSRNRQTRGGFVKIL